MVYCCFRARKVIKVARTEYPGVNNIQEASKGQQRMHGGNLSFEQDFFIRQCFQTEVSALKKF